ncbi:hypothetical protein ACWCQW_03055 [Streptomyces mirabilis]
MSEPWDFTMPNTVIARCTLTLDGVQASAARQVHSDIWHDPGARGHVEREMRLAVAQTIVEKIAPPVFEVDPGSLRRAEESISRAEALRLAKAHTNALVQLASRLEAAGENYAVVDALRAVEAGRMLVAKLESDEGRLPVRPGEEPTT